MRRNLETHWKHSTGVAALWLAETSFSRLYMPTAAILPSRLDLFNAGGWAMLATAWVRMPLFGIFSGMSGYGRRTHLKLS